MARIRKVAGVRPVGWHSRCPHTPNTRRLLVEEGGFIYDSEAYDDDLPYILEVSGRQHVVVPYSLDTNDMRFQRPDSSFARAGDFSDYVIDAFDWLWEEGEATPKMMTIGLHTRIIGRPPSPGWTACSPTSGPRGAPGSLAATRSPATGWQLTATRHRAHSSPNCEGRACSRARRVRRAPWLRSAQPIASGPRPQP